MMFSDLLQVHTIQSDKACAIITYDKRLKLITIAFRGTKDPIDVITDISFIAKTLKVSNLSIQGKV